MDDDRMRRERDLYRQLLLLVAEDDPESLLDEALTLALSVTDAKRGWLELRAADGRRWSLARDLSDDDVDGARAAISTGIVKQALDAGRVVQTASAMQDPRFSDRRSVQNHRIEAVLCAPVGDPAFGVVYLQGRRTPGPFATADLELVALFAEHLARVADRLLAALPPDADDPTAPWRARLVADALVGRSAALAEVLRRAAAVAALDMTVLVTGPTGTGKSQLARVLHASSPRADRPLVAVNCANLQADLLEAELFGAERGAFTGAVRRIEGKVSQAGAGTLFLDEIGEVPVGLQAKLLHLVEERTYTPLGGTPRRSAARILAATNRDLAAMVEEGTFRADLYHRISAFPIRMPGLDERPTDVAVLARHLLARAAVELPLPTPLPLSTAAARWVTARDWPGNVRELDNVLRRAAVLALAEDARRIEPEHLDERAAPPPDGWPEDGSWRDQIRWCQRRILVHALEAQDGNTSAAARRLGLARSRLYELLKVHGLR